ncbi:MAG: RluA family pseudouridine synthase [Deltaproteobacteria bacterium]|nr:RluA family pseudouridine synthase [Deltaproteobacteria bacterium]
MTQNCQFFFEAGRPPERLDCFLAACLPEISRSQIKKLIENQLVRINGQPAKAGEKLKGGETLTVTIPAPVAAVAVPESLPLKILYEDSHLVVIDKPAGMVVHPAPGHPSGTLVNALLNHCQDLAGIGGELRPGIVHRLDKDTSGVLVVSKDEPTHNALSRQFKEHTAKRRYLAIVQGLVKEKTGTVDRPIGRHPRERKKMTVLRSSGRRAVTHWKTLQLFEDDHLSLVELRLETGRTHQIRVHFAQIGHPIVGDPVYGSNKWLKQVADAELRGLLLKLERQALHARILGFEHPQKGSFLEFESSLPPDIMEILEYLCLKYGLKSPSLQFHLMSQQ